MKVVANFLDKVSSMPWDKAKKELQTNIHMAAFDRGEISGDIVETYKSRAGLGGAMAVLAAHCYIKKFGALSAIYKAIEIYKQAADKAEEIPKLMKRVQKLRHEIFNLQALVAYAGYSKAEECGWPFQPRFDSLGERAGFANIMMFLAARELSKEETVCFILATGAVYRFLKEGLERRKKKAA